MVRNRTFWDIFALIAAIGSFAGFYYLSSVLASQSSTITMFLVAIAVSGLVLGFFAYKNDGIKMAAIISALVIAGGIIFGIVVISSGSQIISDLANQGNIFGAILGPLVGLTIIIGGIILMVVGLISSLVLILITAIGSLIGDAVWKDKKHEKAETPVYVTPGAPTQQIQKNIGNSTQVIYCTNCGMPNSPDQDYCTNCGAKMKSRK
ncbi:MAG: zinc-ribbon domain-containing protein [Candidatus Heimdallarchaeaceae archaeon]